MAGYETAIVQLYGAAAGSPTAGLGLLVGSEQVVTCAHVVNTVLGRGQREQEPPGESTQVLVEFPLLPKTPVRLARVVTWVPPPRTGAGTGDVAGLVLTEEAPVGATPARFAAAAAEPGAWLRVFGYPGNPARKTGMWVDVDLKGEVSGGLMIQVESRSDQSVKSQPGYSGSPVWNHSQGQAVGLLHAAPFADEPERGAYLLPPLAVAEAWEQQFDYLLVPDNPYRGLEPFTAEHAGVFCGRDADIAALTARVRAQPVVVVVGPSGVGKSSLVQAGLIPALEQQQRWSVALIRPGQDPWSRLAAGLVRAQRGPQVAVTLEESRREIDRLHVEGLGPVARFLRNEDRPLLVVVDQFEELLAGGGHPDQGLLDLLLPLVGAAEDAARLVMTLRADFLVALQSIPGFHTRLNDRLYLLSPLTAEQMREVVQRPAAARGVAFELGLADQILSDAAGGALPLLEFTLTRLWQTQRRKTLTFAGYHEMSGVHGALNRFAENATAQLADTDAAVLDRVLLRLVGSSFGSTDRVTRQRVLQSQVPAREWQVLRRLAEARLVVLGATQVDGEPYAELVHEALITTWQRLRDLVAENAEFLRWLAWVQQRAVDGDPLPEGRIAEARRWLVTRAAVPDAVIRFIESSEIAAEIRLREARDRTEVVRQSPMVPRSSEVGITTSATSTAEGRWDVFVSYGHEDAGWVQVLAANLHQAGFEVFLDAWELAGGDRVTGRLEEGLRGSVNGVLVVSPHSLSRPWVREEYEALLRQALQEPGRRLVVPVLYADAELPVFLANRLWIDFRGAATGPVYDARLAELVRALRGRPAADRPARDSGADESGGRRRQPNASADRSAFVSYSQRDERYRLRLDISLVQLRRNKLISVWHDRKILPGQEWDQEIDRNLECSDIVLLLVSPDFLASDYAYSREMLRALERHKSGSATVVPIILRPSDWQNSPLGSLQALPNKGRPVSSWPNRDQAWLDVVQGLRRLISGQG